MKEVRVVPPEGLNPLQAAAEANAVLVYSSHKSGTSSLVQTLQASGRPCIHLHFLQNIGLQPGTAALVEGLKAYVSIHQRPATILSCFRLPVERHFSSFFQWYGTGVLNHGIVSTPEESIIARSSLEELQKLFLTELRQLSGPGYEESLHEIFVELGLKASDIQFSADAGFAQIETDLVRLCLLRFDLLFANYIAILEELFRITIQPEMANRSKDKWYEAKYDAFRSSTRIPNALIEATHAHRQDLIELFFPGEYASILASQLLQYGEQDRHPSRASPDAMA